MFLYLLLYTIVHNFIYTTTKYRQSTQIKLVLCHCESFIFLRKYSFFLKKQFAKHQNL